MVIALVLQPGLHEAFSFVQEAVLEKNFSLDRTFIVFSAYIFHGYPCSLIGTAAQRKRCG